MHRGREDSKAKAQATAKANSLVECQPNTGAPLLRDEKARRDWVERELDICCQVTPCLTVVGQAVSWPTAVQISSLAQVTDRLLCAATSQDNMPLSV